MIAILKGEVASKHLDRAVILAGAVGWEVFATPTTLADWQLHQEVVVHTYLVVREDAMTLYGFATAAQRSTFVTLMQVKGIGPKLGLAALSVLSPEELATAVANRDLAVLQRIPGVGKKSGERMLIEIGDKLGKMATSSSVTTEGTSGAVTGFGVDTVVDALVGLGWSTAQATEAMSIVKSTEAGAALREALQYLGGQHG